MVFVLKKNPASGKGFLLLFSFCLAVSSCKAGYESSLRVSGDDQTQENLELEPQVRAIIGSMSLDVPGASASSGEQTIRFSYSVDIDVPVASLEDLARNQEPFARLGDFSTLMVIDPSDGVRGGFQEIARPLYHSVTQECMVTEEVSCLRLVSGRGVRTERADVMILNFEKQPDWKTWKLTWYSIYGNQINDANLPVDIVMTDSRD